MVTPEMNRNPNILAPYYLRPDQRILEQEPFLFVLKMIPENFFKPAASRFQEYYTLINNMNTWREHDLESLNIQTIEDLKNPKHYGYTWFEPIRKLASKTFKQQFGEQEVLRVVHIVHRTFEGYPYIFDYIRDKGPSYNGEGFLRNWRLALPEMTFPAYQYEMLAGDRLAQRYGITEVLPSAFSTGEDIQSALPAKGNVNRKFRLIHASDALK
jgi:hypothetical protein